MPSCAEVEGCLQVLPLGPILVQGSASTSGLIPRAMERIFEMVSKIESDLHHEIRVSATHLHEDTFHDLLVEHPEKVRIRLCTTI